MALTKKPQFLYCHYFPLMRAGFARSTLDRKMREKKKIYFRERERRDGEREKAGDTRDPKIVEDVVDCAAVLRIASLATPAFHPIRILSNMVPPLRLQMICQK